MRRCPWWAGGSPSAPGRASASSTSTWTTKSAPSGCPSWPADARSVRSGRAGAADRDAVAPGGRDRVRATRAPQRQRRGRRAGRRPATPGRSSSPRSTGEVVGHVHAQPLAGSTPASRLVDVLVLSPLSVAPEHQGERTGHSAAVTPRWPRRERLGRPGGVPRGRPRSSTRARGWARPGPAHGFTPPSARIPGPAFQVQCPRTAGEPWMTGCAGLRASRSGHSTASGCVTPLLGQIEQTFES